MNNFHHEECDLVDFNKKIREVSRFNVGDLVTYKPPEMKKMSYHNTGNEGNIFIVQEIELIELEYRDGHPRFRYLIVSPLDGERLLVYDHYIKRIS